MSKVKHIIIREYTTRVRKKVFIIMTILGPVLFAALMIAPVWLTQLEDQDEKIINVVEFDRYGKPVPDSLMLFRGVFKDKPLLKFKYIGGITDEQLKVLAIESNSYGFLSIRHNVIFSGQDVSVELHSKQQPSLDVELHITNSLENYLQNKKLLTYNVPTDIIKNLKTNVWLSTHVLDKTEFKAQGNTMVKRIVGYASSLLIYMFIFIFGSLVMRGVVEEKTNRIVEVIITSVKPFQLMLGKIIGVGLVGLTQFLAWVILTAAIVHFSSSYLVNQKLEELKNEQNPVELFQSQSITVAPPSPSPQQQNTDMLKALDLIKEVDFALTLGLFVFYFIGGYLLYGAMLAAVGSAVDSETDTQQFMLPVTLPLILSIVVMANVIANPSGQLAFWFSMIPFTSPIIMMARIPFGVPIEQIIASALILVISFVALTWLSAKIYRTGILMYGKKVSLREIIKWMKYK